MRHFFINRYRIWFAGIIVLVLAMGAGQAGSASETLETSVTCRIETDRDVFQAGRSQRAIIKVTLDAPPPPTMVRRPPVNLAIVLDRSGSMAGAKIDRAREAAVEALSRLGQKDIFSLVVYDQQVDTVIPAGPALYGPDAVSRIRRIQPGGSTALFGGVSQGAAEVRKYLDGSYVHRIVLLSDGLANVGPRTPEDLGRLGAALLKENISVTTVGVGTDYNEDLMARLSQNSDGNIYFVESSQELARIFSQELGDVLSVVARKITVEVTFPDTVRPLGIIGREGRILGRTVELSMNQLYGSQEKYALIEVELPGAGSGSQMEIATATVRYDNLLTRTSDLARGRSVARFSTDPRQVEASANPSVIREYQLNLNALAQEKAISLSDKGKSEEAVKTLKDSAAKLKEVGGTYQDADLLKRADEIEMQAESIEAQGMTKRERKVLRTKSFQMKNQQSSE
ncbi:MAG: VWA domain-containing protein [Pseudomonadota bacterium]